MPLYDYHCDKCDETFEVLQKFSDEPLKVHEGCGGKVERLLSPPALQFKGSGWYVTDYAKGGKSSSTTSANGHAESKSESKKSETKSESKSATGSSSEK
jgi:putative FmdB family regulatory protein